MVDLKSSWPWSRSPKRYAVSGTLQVSATLLLLLLLSCFCCCNRCCGCVYPPTTPKTATVAPAHNFYLVSICSYPVYRKGCSAAETKQNKSCLTDVRFENVFVQPCQPLSMCTTPMRVPWGSPFVLHCPQSNNRNLDSASHRNTKDVKSSWE